MSDLPQPTFSAGELTPLMYGRTDLTKYGAGLRRCKNWIIRPHGCLMNRAGSEYLAATKFSGASKSRLVPFEFSDEQTYILEFSVGFVRVYQNGVYAGIELATTYVEDDLDKLQYMQSADVLTIMRQRVPQKEVRRTSTGPLAFAFTQPSYNDGPFLTQNAVAGIQVSSSAKTGTVTLTSNVAIFNANHVGALFRLEQEDVSTVKPWEPTKILKTAAASPVGEVRRNDGKTYLCTAPVPGGGTVNTATGSIPPTHDSGIEMDGDGNKIASFADIVGVSWQYQDSGFGIVRITAFTSSTQVTATVLRQLPATVIGTSSAIHGPYNFTGDGATTVFGPLTGNTSAVSSEYVVTGNGLVYSSGEYTVTQPNGNITFSVAPGVGVAIVVTQVAGTAGTNRTSLWSFGAWSTDQGYPATGTYFQDRAVFAGTTGQPQGKWASKTGLYYNFGTSVPSEDSDSLAIFLNARKINAITDIIALEALLDVTSSGVWRVTDGTDEVLTPTTLGFKPQNYTGGKKDVRSALVGDSAVYVQRDGRRIRDLLFTLEFDKFTGNELSLLAEHLFPKGKQITRLDYAQYPFSLLHAVRSDGVVPTLSYLREQEVMGWSTFETDGVIEDVCSITEGDVSRTYQIVRRVINGVSVRYIERYYEREFVDLVDAVFLDSAVTRDGRVTGATVTVTGGTLWDSSETLFLTASATLFNTFDDAYDTIVYLYGVDAGGSDVTIRVKISNQYTGTFVDGVPDAQIPTTMRGVAISTWAIARRYHNVMAPSLANEDVRVCADSLDAGTITVAADGTVLLQDPAIVVHIGISYQSDVETLDVNIPGGPSVRGKRKLIPRVHALVHQTRGLSFGPDEDHLVEMPAREYEDPENPPDLQEDVKLIVIPTKPDKNGRVFVRQDAPLPATLIGLIPDVDFG